MNLNALYRVRRLRSVQGARSVTLLGPGGVVEPVDQYVTGEELIGRKAYNTLVAACFDLKLWFEFLEIRGLAWDTVRWNDNGVLARFVAWLRYGDQLDAGQSVIPLQPKTLRAETTIGRILNSLYSFYDFHSTTPFAQSLREHGQAQLTRHALRHRTRLPRPVQLQPPGRVGRPKVLTQAQVQGLKDACRTLRDRLLITLLADRGLRLGQALGLRHEDWDSRRAVLRIVPRDDNSNGAYTKTDRIWELPLASDILDLHTGYMFDEYGDGLCDYVFLTQQGTRRGEAMTFDAVRSVVEQLRRRTGIDFHPHMLRHTFATHQIGLGVPVGVVQAMLTHKHASTTTGIYTHLGSEDLRRWIDGLASSTLDHTHGNLSDPETMRRLLDGTGSMR